MEEKLVSFRDVWGDEKYYEHLEEFLTDGWTIKEFKIESVCNKYNRSLFVVVHLVKPFKAELT